MGFSETSIVLLPGDLVLLRPSVGEPIIGLVVDGKMENTIYSGIYTPTFCRSFTKWAIPESLKMHER